MGDIVKQKPNEIQQVQITEKEIEDYLFTSETRLNDKQKKLFVQMSKMHNLNPFKREIHAIPYGRDFSVVTGYQVYLQRAEATGLLNGWNCDSIRNDEGKLLGAKITIHRKDFEHPFTWEVSMSDFAKNYGSWKSMPEFMIKKVAMGQGFRLAFPNELGSLPYLAEELEGADNFDNKPKSKSVQKEENINYEQYFKSCKTAEEIKEKYAKLPEEEKHKDSIAYKEALARKEFLAQQVTDPLSSMIQNIRVNTTEEKLKEIDALIDKVKDSDSKREYLEKFKNAIANKNLDYTPEATPF